MNILLIDDEPNLFKMLKRPLRQHGHTIIEAHDGKEGWKIFTEAANMFDVIITDIRMPVLDGLELLKRLREREYDIPVIVITGYEDIQASIEILRLGAFDFLLKPFEAQDLLDILTTLQEILDNKKRQIQELPFFTENIDIEIHSHTKFITTVGSFLQDRIKLFCQLYKLDERNISFCLHEALVNAIIHGNLEISSSLKNDSLEEYEQLWREREQMPEFANRKVRIRCEIQPEYLKFEIEDEGRGFDPNKVQQGDPVTMLPYGRGLLIITAYMDEVSWNGAGNHITMIKRFPPPDALPAPKSV